MSSSSQPVTPYRMIDLFAGTGAFSHVFEKHGCTCVFANDLMESSQNIYTLNHGLKANHDTPKNPKKEAKEKEKKEASVFILGDLNQIPVESIPAHDILCGGFPCQPFSIAGKQRGFEDTRSNVFFKLVEIMAYHKPRIIVLENVKNLTSHDHGNTYRVILEKLTELGYHLHTRVLDTRQITSVPQHRERIYIVGFLDKAMHDAFTFDTQETKDTKETKEDETQETKDTKDTKETKEETKEKEKISDWLESEVPDKYYYTDKLKVFPEIQKGVTKRIDEDNVMYQYRRYYIRENKSNCCPTLTANMGSGGHNVPLIKDAKGIRKLTPRECFTLQGFPRDYALPTTLSDSALYTLAGNAVSVPVIEWIAQKLFAQPNPH